MDPIIEHSKVKQWGNSLALRLTSEVARAAGVSNDSAVTIIASSGKLTVEVSSKRMTLAERLARFDPVRHGGEIFNSAPVGREIL